ncbi:MAG: relaxase/mobilization nuclease domain-containing protein [Pseudomonadota bacterium]
MIVAGNQRGGAKDLALHLMKPENEHVEVHELRGFASENLMGALNEVYAISRGTHCKQFLYSTSFNPPPNEKVSIADFEAAIEKVEKKLNLAGQPRAIVFHEKEGRRHCHVVWSRIKVDSMTAVQMSHDHKKLKAVSRELFIEHGWQIPEGLVDSRNRNPKNFTRAEYEQAKRIGMHPKAIKAAFRDAWAISDSKSSFVQALEEFGYFLAKGDKIPYVAVDMNGEIYSIPKQTGRKTKEIRERLGDEANLRSVDDLKSLIAKDMLSNFEKFKGDLKQHTNERLRDFESRLVSLARKQKAERLSLYEHQGKRSVEENRIRQSRFRKGIKGLWDVLRGEHRRIQKFNENEAEAYSKRDRLEKDQLIAQHLEQRKQLELFKLQTRRDYVRDSRILERDSEVYRGWKKSGPKGPEPEFE